MSIYVEKNILYDESDLAILISLPKTDFAVRESSILSMSFKLWKSFPTITKPSIPVLPCGVQWYKYTPGKLKVTE